MDKLNLTKEPNHTKVERLLSVDIVRGISIFGVLFIHPMIYGTWQTETNALNIVPLWIVLFFIPIILMGTWGGGFPLISGVVNTYNIYNRLEQGFSFRESVKPILINSTLILLIDPLKAFLFGRTWTNSYEEGINYSVFSRLIEKGELAMPGAERIFQIGSLPSIGISGFVTVFILWILFKNNDRKKIKRNIIIIASLGVIFTLLSNPINEAINPIVIDLFLKGGFLRFISYLLRLFIGAQLSFFPVGTYVFFGIVGGYLLSIKAPMKDIKKFGYGFGILYLIGFIVTTTLTIINSDNVENAIFGILDYEIYPRELLFLSLGCMMFLFVGLVKRYEYIPMDLKAKRAKKSLFFRRFGVVTLTFYVIEPIFSISIAFLFHSIFGDTSVEFGTPDPFMSNFFAILLYFFTFESFWILFSIFWAKTGFKYGFEYWILKFSTRFRKTKSTRLKLYDYLPKSEEISQIVKVDIF